MNCRLVRASSDWYKPELVDAPYLGLVTTAIEALGPHMNGISPGSVLPTDVQRLRHTEEEGLSRTVVEQCHDRKQTQTVTMMMILVRYRLSSWILPPRLYWIHSPQRKFAGKKQKQYKLFVKRK